jgi:hypothetical protein
VIGQNRAVLRITLALLATIVLGVLAALSGAMFAIVLVTKFTILFGGWQPMYALAMFGSSTFTLGWLAMQTAEPLRRDRIGA